MKYEVSFDYGVKYKHHIIQFRDIAEDAPDKPGLYGWFIRFDPRSGTPSANSLLKSSTQDKLDVTMKGYLRLMYEGEVEKVKPQLPNLESNVQFWSDCFFAFSYPIYIGISKKSLKNRLSSHKKIINNLFQRGNFDPEFTRSLSNEMTTENELSEDKQLGERFNSWIKEHPDVTLSHLFVRTIELEDASLSSDNTLKDVENVLNGIYNPIFGRR